MPTLTYRGGPQDGVQHSASGRIPPQRYYAAPGERGKTGWVELNRYTYKCHITSTQALYEWSGIYTVKGPRPAKGIGEGEVIEGWE